MDGVTILSEVSCRSMELFEVISIWLVFAILLFFISSNVLDLWSDGFRHYILKSILTILGLSVPLLFLLSSVEATNRYRTFYTEYEVMVDDSVGFNEFYNHYEIIYRDGDTYTVREKDE